MTVSCEDRQWIGDKTLDLNTAFTDGYYMSGATLEEQTK